MNVSLYVYDQRVLCDGSLPIRLLYAKNLCLVQLLTYVPSNI